MEDRLTWRFAAILVLTWAILLFLFLPILATIPVSFTPGRFLEVPALGDYSLHQYTTLLSSEAWLNSILQSAVIASISTAIAVILGTSAAIGLWRVSSGFAELIRGFVLMPIIVPPVVSALAFYRLCVDLRIFDSYAGMVLAHTILIVPFVVITVSASLANFNYRLEQAARNLGASVGQTLRYVILPNIKPGIFSGAIFAFVLSWDEIIVTLFITSRAIFTLPRRIWSGIRENLDPVVAAVATMLIALTLIAIVAYLILEWRRTRGASAVAESP